MSFFKFIPTMNTGIVQTFGKFGRLATPGLTFYIPFVQSVHLVSNRLSQNQCKMQVRTSDKVFPTLDISLQYKIHPEDTAKAYFELNDPVKQMISYTENTVRKIASSLSLDELFESQTQISDAILQNVGPIMKKGGFTIESAQVRNIQPPEDVLKSMNQINASQRRKQAAKNDGQAAKIKAVLLAQADAQQKSLRGKGISDMRNNITEGWAHSVAQMAKQTGISPMETLNFLYKVLQQQTMETMSKHAGSKVIFVEKGGNASERDAMIQALETHAHQAQSIHPDLKN